MLKFVRMNGWKDLCYSVTQNSPDCNKTWCGYLDIKNNRYFTFYPRNGNTKWEIVRI